MLPNLATKPLIWPHCWSHSSCLHVETRPWLHIAKYLLFISPGKIIRLFWWLTEDPIHVTVIYSHLLTWLLIFSLIKLRTLLCSVQYRYICVVLIAIDVVTLAQHLYRSTRQHIDPWRNDWRLTMRNPILSFATRYSNVFFFFFFFVLFNIHEQFQRSVDWYSVGLRPWDLISSSS